MTGRKKADSSAAKGPRRRSRASDGGEVVRGESGPSGGNLKPRGRSTPGKLTDEVLERICAAIASGSTKVEACAAEGVSDTALHMLRKARPDVDERVRVAEGLGVRWYRERVATCEAGKDASDDWRRWAWLAERLHPRDFKPPPQESDQRLSGPDGAALVLTVAQADALATDGRLPEERGDGET